jgi:hypothetical protein
MKLILANGAMLEAPVYENRARSSNWLAIIDIDHTMPGGLERRFVERGKGECLYATESIGMFDPVEFAADYTTSVGRKHRQRWYGVVVAKTDDYLRLEECETGASAVLRSKELRRSPQALVAALREGQDAHIAQAARLQQQIDELEGRKSFDEPAVDEPAVEGPETLWRARR